MAQVIARLHEKVGTDSLRLFMVGPGNSTNAAVVRQVAEASAGGRFYSTTSANLAAVCDWTRGFSPSRTWTRPTSTHA